MEETLDEQRTDDMSIHDKVEEIDLRVASIEAEIVDMREIGYGAPEGEDLVEYVAENTTHDWEDIVKSAWQAFIATLTVAP